MSVYFDKLLSAENTWLSGENRYKQCTQFTVRSRNKVMLKAEIRKFTWVNGIGPSVIDQILTRKICTLGTLCLFYSVGSQQMCGYLVTSQLMNKWECFNVNITTKSLHFYLKFHPSISSTIKTKTEARPERKRDQKCEFVKY